MVKTENSDYALEFGPYEYTGNVYDDIDNKMTTVKGITFANSLPEAAKNIWVYYGNTMDDVRIAAVEPSSVYEFGKDNGCIFNTAGVEMR